MNRPPAKSDLPPPKDPHGIAKCAQTYAQNRSLGVVISMIVFLLLCAAIGGPSYLAGEAYRSGNMLLFWVAIALLVPAVGALGYCSVPRWGGKLLERLTQRLYAKEGNVSFLPPSGRAKVLGYMLAVFLGTCVVASVTLGSVFEIPTKYMQPISALYVVPFLVCLWLLMRPMVGWAALLWPLLFALHAILILAGAPILFTAPWDGLNMLIPIAGYGILAGLVGHLQSRVALARLKRLTRVDPAGPDQSEEASGQ
jgi:hypothetical protein